MREEAGRIKRQDAKSVIHDGCVRSEVLKGRYNAGVNLWCHPVYISIYRMTHCSELPFIYTSWFVLDQSQKDIARPEA